MCHYTFMWAEENYPYSDFEHILLNYGARSKKRFGCGISNGLVCGKDFHAEFYLPEEELKKEAECWYDFFMNKKNFNSLLKRIRLTKQQVMQRIRILLKTDLTKLNNEQLWNVYSQFFTSLGDLFRCYIISQPHRVKKLEDELRLFLQDRTADVPQYVSILTAPKKRFVFLKAGNVLFKSSFAEAIGGEQSKIDKTLLHKKFYKEEKVNQTERNKLIRELKPDSKAPYLAEVLRVLAEERFKMRCMTMPAQYYGELFLIEFKRRFGVSKKELRAYEDFQIEKLIRYGKKLDDKTIRLRKEGFIKFLKNGKIITIQGKKAQAFKSKIIKKTQKSDTINGDVASPGHAVGKVIIFSYTKSKEHAKKKRQMRTGDIVVTEMTRPNIISACEKAGAIITDEGGILSHAAIISRELGIPCIIGTKIATKVLKDGCFVEVDAHTGIITAISKKEYQLKKKESATRKQVSAKQIVSQKVNALRQGDIFWFRDIGKNDLLTVGGKGAHLGELSKFVNVPPGFCISADCYRQFLEEHKLPEKINKILKPLQLREQRDLEKRAEKIQKLIMSHKINPHLTRKILSAYHTLRAAKVAVRSSATAEDLPTASFAGQQDTYLNIRGEQALIKAVQKCWSSLFTPRVVYYREKNNFKHTSVLMSVVVQQMVQPRYAGVMFTRDPITKKDMVVEVVRGLGEELVSGRTTPNNYSVNKTTLQVLPKKEVFSMNRRFVQQLGKLGKLIEKHYGFPQDIEFAIDRTGKIFILQSRAITTL